MTHRDHAPATLGDTMYEAFYSAALGGAAIALFFLMIDTLAGRPLYTPSLLGSVIILGQDPATVTGVDLGAMALFTVLHFAAFGALGFFASWLVRALEHRFEGSAIPPLVTLFLIVLAGLWIPARIADPALVDVVGQGRIFLAAALTAGTMTAFLRYAHGTSENRREGRDGAAAGASAQPAP